MKRNCTGRFKPKLRVPPYFDAFCVGAKSFGPGKADNIVGALGEFVFVVFDDAD